MFCDGIPPPPPRYDSGYTPPYVVRYVTREYIQDILDAELAFCGWTDVNKTPMVVYVVKNGNRKQIIRHELGHVRGWRHPVKTPRLEIVDEIKNDNQQSY